MPCPQSHGYKVQDQFGHPGGVWHQSLCHGHAPLPMPGLCVDMSLLPYRENMEQVASVNRTAFRAPSARDRHPSGLGKAEAAAPGPGRPPHPRSSKAGGSHESSLTSLEGSGSPEQLVQKSSCQAGRPHREVSGCRKSTWSYVSPHSSCSFVQSSPCLLLPSQPAQPPDQSLPSVSPWLSLCLPTLPRPLPGVCTLFFSVFAPWISEFPGHSLGLAVIFLLHAWFMP